MRKPPQAIAVPTRFLVEQPGGRPTMTEASRQCLYSCAYLATAGGTIAREIELFNFVMGQPVPGPLTGHTATRFHTNMQLPKQLQAPEMFAVQQIRVHVPGFDFQTVGAPAIDDDTAGGAVARMQQIDDATFLLASTAIEFKIGGKVYAEGPSWMFPFNCGMDGLVDTAAAGAGPGWQTRNAIFGMGRPFRFDRLSDRTPLLWNGQTFGASVSCQWGGGNPTIRDGKLFFMFLDGIHGRAVQ